MTVQFPAAKTWTADEFLRSAERHEGRFELVDGRIADVMIDVTRDHVRLATRLILALGTRLDPEIYDVGTADFGVKISPRGVRLPDVFVDRFAGGEGRDLGAPAPVLLAEILSPSSFARDFKPKAVEYTSLPTLLHYLVLSPDEPRLWFWSRDEAGGFAEPALLEGPEAQLELAGLSLSLPLAELYRGIA
ncbi:hypothetical protein GCM10011390_27760 [Aureimonas endophytica]|uniref:Putative restriction endonuclease domain-containing protein n=1 Tax=Aureimonas endophytica TaxID=2027858 RepID=A0A917E5Q9_9HYPH|nr:Uma2 family endonuclease [Aureimonas endophytica]GGE07153.1 hypothetical protein GCM10011390_27760 [Aureimonas endophytica]